MIQLIKESPIDAIFIMIIVIAFIIYLIKYKQDILEKAALKAVSQAEAEWTSGTGRIKFAEAYTYIKKNYPIITFFVTEKELTDTIEEALVELKKIIKTKKGKEGDIISLKYIFTNPNSVTIKSEESKQEESNAQQ